jgi:hypothetical protein
MAERVVVLPCNIGDKIYDIYSGKIQVREVISIEVFSFMIDPKVSHGINMESLGGRIGKTAFFTLEEAENALKQSA